MRKKIFSCQFLLSDIAILCYLALVKLILHLLTNGQYGYFRDELYYIACSDHLAFGYVDQPPLSIFILAINRWLWGDSLFALRLLPAVAGALVVFLTGLMVRQLGGGRFAQVLGALAVIVSPAMLGQSRFFSMNAFDILFWALAAYIVILIVKNNNPKLWPLFGLVAGLGLLNKYSMFFFGFGLVMGLMLTSHRKHLVNKWFWLAGLIALVIFLPHIIWEIKYDFPSIEFMRNASLYKNIPISFSGFLFGQFLQIGFAHAPIWMLGLYYYFFHKEGKQYRLLGWMYVIIFTVLVVGNAKVYYLSPIYPMLLASGALVIERFIRHYHWNWLKPVIASILIICGCISAPYAIPVLPIETFIKYTDFIGIKPEAEERHELKALPQYYADMFGWEEMVATVAGVYHSLSPKEQSKCTIFTSNYGEAGSIDFFGKRYHLPKAISGHNNYYLWGPGDKIGEVVISLRISLESLKRLFEVVEQADMVECRYCMPYENNYPVYICRNPKISLQEVWPYLKHYD